MLCFVYPTKFIFAKINATTIRENVTTIPYGCLYLNDVFFLNYSCLIEINMCMQLFTYAYKLLETRVLSKCDLMYREV